ncbi:MAG: hypothetical protein EZS28_027148 [Streblomastix strix]|uniref:Uncharacterized protein n=1 Tax=Streblomastix strix TaxID=222440 RepID=A0A5J4V3Y3_9EUKA|nr:MAG: hypothetical protein EZS28_027148 [Streblomastix strix]
MNRWRRGLVGGQRTPQTNGEKEIDRIQQKTISQDSITIPTATVVNVKGSKKYSCKPKHRLKLHKFIQQQTRKHSSPHTQQHSPSPSLEETLAILRTISPGDPRGYKERELERKQPKLHQHAGLMYVVERFHEIMKPIIEEEKKKPKVMLLGQYKEYPNKDGPAFFYPPKNYRPALIPRPKDRNLSEKQWKQFDVNLGRIYQEDHTSQDYQTLVMEWLDSLTYTPQIYQSIPEAVIGLFTFAAQQIVESETENKDQEQLSNEIERIIADGTDDNGNNDQSEHAIEPKHFTNGNDGLRKNDSGTQLQATVNGEAKSEIHITKTSANTLPYNLNGSDRLGGKGCGTQLQAITNENGHQNHQVIDITGKENIFEQANDNRTGGQQNNQGSNNETQHKQDSGNNKRREIGSSHTTHSEQELINSNISQPKGQPLLITKHPELGQAKGKVVVPKQRMQPTNDHDTRIKTGQLKSVPNKSFGSPEARANSDSPNHFKPQQEQRKKADVAQLLKTSPQNTPKATRTVQDPRNRNKDSTSKIRQKQSPTPGMTSWISQTEQK